MFRLLIAYGGLPIINVPNVGVLKNRTVLLSGRIVSNIGTRKVNKTVELTCMCCGFTQHFKDGEEAFDLGWDAPPHFRGYVSCDLCPGSLIVLNKIDVHGSTHARWQREGRPSLKLPVY